MGEAIAVLQKCHTMNAFPNFLQGATERAQQCQTKNAPTIFIWCRDYLAEMPLLTRTKGRAKILLQKCHVTKALPNQLQGFNAQSQKCHNAHNPRKGATFASQKCHSANAPTEFGPPERSRNAKSMPPNNQRPPRDRSNAIAEAPRN
jgi:hypothetical protein